MSIRYRFVDPNHKMIEKTENGELRGVFPVEDVQKQPCLWRIKQALENGGVEDWEPSTNYRPPQGNSSNPGDEDEGLTAEDIILYRFMTDGRPYYGYPVPYGPYHMHPRRPWRPRPHPYPHPPHSPRMPYPRRGYYR